MVTEFDTDMAELAIEMIKEFGIDATLTTAPPDDEYDATLGRNEGDGTPQAIRISPPQGVDRDLVQSRFGDNSEMVEQSDLECFCLGTVTPEPTAGANLTFVDQLGVTQTRDVLGVQPYRSGDLVAAFRLVLRG